MNLPQDLKRIRDIFFALLQLAVPVSKWMRNAFVYLDRALCACVRQDLMIRFALRPQHVPFGAKDTSWCQILVRFCYDR
jgi:hypothetical protein